MKNRVAIKIDVNRLLRLLYIFVYDVVDQVGFGLPVHAILFRRLKYIVMSCRLPIRAGRDFSISEDGA